MSPDQHGRSNGALRLVPNEPQSVPPQPAQPIDVRSKPDDHALLAAIRAGDESVAAALCNRLWPQVDRTIRRLLGRFDADREDLAQISLIEIVNTIGRYRGECSLDRWAQTVTAHVVFKHLRRRNIERRLFSELLSDDGHPAPIQIERISLTRQLLARVAEHLDGMNTPRVWAFLLHDVMGFDLQEIAEMTGTSVSAAQSRLSRGRRELHDHIAHDPELLDLIRKGELQG
jgi:RNA polymerase sigma-70 factor (ECF subfamily)